MSLFIKQSDGQEIYINLDLVEFIGVDKSKNVIIVRFNSGNVTWIGDYNTLDEANRVLNQLMTSIKAYKLPRGKVRYDDSRQVRNNGHKLKNHGGS